jgi:hypothetical protein
MRRSRKAASWSIQEQRNNKTGDNVIVEGNPELTTPLDSSNEKWCFNNRYNFYPEDLLSVLNAAELQTVIKPVIQGQRLSMAPKSRREGLDY